MKFDEQKFHAHVRRLFIKPSDTLGRALHAAVGVSGEAGELLDAIKKTWIYEEPLDLENIIEECGDSLFYRRFARSVRLHAGRCCRCELCQAGEALSRWLHRPGRARPGRQGADMTAHGSALPQSILTPAAVLEIRAACEKRDDLRAHIRDNLSNEALAKRFGVHVRTVEKVVSYGSWRHVLTP